MAALIDRWFPWFLLGIAAVSLAFLVHPPGWFQDTSPVVDLSRVDPAPSTPDGTTLRFAITPILSTERTIDEYQDLAAYIGRSVGRPVRLIQRKTYGEISEMLRHGTVNLAIVCSGAYCRARRDGVPLDVIAAEGPIYQSIFVVREDGPLRSIADLRGCTFAFTDPLSLIGHDYPIHHLLQRGLDYRVFFGRTMFTYSHDRSLQAVLDGTADAAAANSRVYNAELVRNPDLKKRLRVIDQSPPLGISPVVVPQGIDPGLKESLRRAFFALGDDDEGRRILKDLGWQRFETPPEDLFRRVDEIHERIRKFLGSD